ncbi:hypothetical protein RCG24_05060 [Neobacillus sp. OS1-32]|jgi:hypothetical protein|uniref:hypothetical protein n=1 Tax=Neobacillus sp. OS1-32 TaxID=3070682 RepID=UPI0027DFD181|nr:hypothetical protein [Neobacillus sp. OS1-32]WML31249.1 hypothetical protein RCG24_05060 [Neobacillus sp. OS1-32]
MVVVHFLEDKTVVLSQLRKQIPTVNEAIKIKGRRGKVESIVNVSDKVVQIQVSFEKVKKVQPALKDVKKR